MLISSHSRAGQVWNRIVQKCALIRAKAGSTIIALKNIKGQDKLFVFPKARNVIFSF